MQSHRRPTEFENDVMRKILSEDPPLTARFAGQLSDAEVVALDEYGSLGIKPAGAPAERTPSSVMRKLPVEASATDSDGIELHFLLFERDGWLCELQIYKDDGSPIRQPPDIRHVETLALKRN